jgi:oxygen-independent coproporphyrinogen-3 oxidase
MLPLSTIPSYRAESVPVNEDDARVLHERMKKPQRHRLLHGYPLAAATPRISAGQSGADVVFYPQAERGLLVGVLPHPFCNPAVTGCGFCTFPHEAYRAPEAAAVGESVVREIDQRVRRQPWLRGRKVSGLYIGGGTANLTPAEIFCKLCRALASTFDLSQAEVTLEGVPAYFIKRQPLLVDILRQEVPARQLRLSMGIQTFDPARLRQMGRQAFGDAATFSAVVELGHRYGFTVSADFLFNLPGQSLAEMRADIAQADAIGLDHLGLYHLVLFRGLGTAWSRDPAMLAALPSNEQAADHWLALRDDLLARDFIQTSLTNFERRRFASQAERYVYEEYSFQPDRFDMLGFGPSGISFAADREYTLARKVINPDGAIAYREAVARGRSVGDRYFFYGARDLRVFLLTRQLAALVIDRQLYRELFETDPVDDFPGEWAALAAENLVDIGPRTIRPTPRGMFYADSITALLAWRRVRALETRALRSGERGRRTNDNAAGHM